MKITGFMILALAAGVIGVSCSKKDSRAEAADSPEKSEESAFGKMPAFNLAYLDGKRFDSNSLRGKVLFIDFWATWCGPCLEEIPNMVKLHDKYKSQGFEVVGITVQSGDAEDIAPTVEKLGINYHVLLGNEEVMESFGGIYGFPTNFIVDREGRIVKKYLGIYPNKEKVVEAEIRKLLGLPEEG